MHMQCHGVIITASLMIEPFVVLVLKALTILDAWKRAE
jgi:hypothetical protein